MRKSLGNELKKLFDWLCANRLSLNSQKTDLILFKPSSRKTELRLTVKIGDTKIFPSNTIKYLGVLIDTALTWRPQIEELSKKLTRVVAILSKVRHFVPFNTLKCLYYSLFQSYISYGCLVWGFASTGDLQRLFRIQKQAIRVITFSDFQQPSSKLFADTQILKLADLIEFNKYMFMYEWKHGKLPSSFNSLFSEKEICKGTRLASHGKLYIPKIRTMKYGERSLRFAGTKILNHIINLQVDLDVSKMQFKRQLLALFIATY